MSKRELAEILFEMSMDMDWMDYADSKEPAIQELENDLEKTGSALNCALESIAMSFA